MEEQAGLHARQRIELLPACAAALCKPRRTVGYLSQQAIQTFLRELEQGEVLWNIGAVIRPEGLSNQLLQARYISLCQPLHAFWTVLLATVLQGELQLLSHDQGDDIELMRSLVLGGMLPAGVFGCQREERLTTEHLVKLAQVVEADCRLPLLLQALPDLDIRMQIAQQAIADAALRQAPQLAPGHAQRLQRLGLRAHLQHQRE